LNITLDSSAEEIQKHLKEYYSLRCKFIFIEKKPIPSKNAIFPFLINGDTILNELSSILPFLGLKIDFLNSEGQSVPMNLSLDESKDYKFIVDEEYEFNQLIKSLDAILTTNDYSDIEWIKRIIIRSIEKANSPKKLEIVQEKIEIIYSINEKFMKSDYDEVFQFLKKKTLKN
tara:strand:+ start:1567 stop:2085 length:519 start_codon:yes stop_codon:yes gene_type:complete